ncbi:hypothetical protein U8V72_23250 [Priestia filamentosa]|uniref:hypothetical protein n=1 Tax=Priestia filamentosa TaxID=1402861 RepID=UPI0005893FA7
MQLLSKPENLNYKKKREYETFHFFQLALTERNWTGSDYITKEDCAWFINELKEFDDAFNNMFGHVLTKSRFTFLLDTSIFSDEIPENYKSNHKIIDFLEELEDFEDFDEESKEIAKRAKKYLSKLKSFSTKIENMPYIYRWALQYEDHPFSVQIKTIIEEEVKRIGISSRKNWLSDRKKLIETIRKKNLDPYKDKDKISAIDVKIVEGCEKRDKHFVSQILKYSISEPSLFFYGVYFIIQYFKEMDEMMDAGYEFVSFERDGNKVDVFLKDSTNELNELFLAHETFISSLPKVKRRADGWVSAYHTLYDLQGKEFDNEEQTKDVLRTISDWVINRIKDKSKYSLPRKNWLHPVKSELFSSMGINYIYFEDISTIGGPSEEELLIKAHAFMEDGAEILFPLFDPNSWDDLNAVQCALIAYSLCLFHDVAIEQNYEMLQQEARVPGRNSFEYLLVTHSSHTDPTPLQLNNKSNGKSAVTEKNADKESHIKNEHWVSFHFRRLQPGYKASERQRAVASKYGIKKLPTGFTFVDSHVRGEKNNEEEKMRFSALDILNKTLSKLDTYYNLEKTH